MFVQHLRPQRSVELSQPRVTWSQVEVWLFVYFCRHIVRSSLRYHSFLVVVVTKFHRVSPRTSFAATRVFRDSFSVISLEGPRFSHDFSHFAPLLRIVKLVLQSIRLAYFSRLKERSYFILSQFHLNWMRCVKSDSVRRGCDQSDETARPTSSTRENIIYCIVTPMAMNVFPVVSEAQLLCKIKQL